MSFINLDQIYLPASSTKEKILAEFREAAGDIPEGSKAAFLTDGSVGTAVAGAILCELFGRENVTAVLTPNLSIGNQDAIDVICGMYAGDIKVIPVTMTVADTMSALEHAGLPVESKASFDRLENIARHMILTVLDDHGYYILDEFRLEGSTEELLRLLRDELNLPDIFLQEFENEIQNTRSE